ncbi:MAG: FtsX-like permease family protein, partial [Spirochaetia bacterium]|nr:FtsX-like permease family protein [Spirochaetia bacterium]
SFERSLTGDAALSARTETAFSLFGSEVPKVSENESIPPIPDYQGLVTAIQDLDGVAAWTPIVAGVAQMRLGGYAVNVPVFGVDPATYFNVCSDIVIEQGDSAALASGGVFINAVLAATMEAAIGRPLVPGEDLVFGMYSGGSFRLKKGSFAGVHRYVSSTEALDLVVLADATLVRSMANYTLGFASAGAPAQLPAADEAFDLDDLFSDAADVTSADDPGLTLESVEATMADTGERDALVMTDAAAWSFVLIKAAEGQADTLVASLAAAIDGAGLECRAMSWRSAAGTSAQALFAVQTAFYIGLGFVALGAVLVIMNALVISVLERSAEIGTMRGLGAGKSFIRRLFIAESMLLTLGGALVGILAGALIAGSMARNGFAVTNPLLVSLFGGNLVRPLVSLRSVFMHLVLASAVGALAWIYPVSLAMRIQPVAAMNAG